ncbi:MAG: heparinase II/III family protein [Beijerinckiaceae bacterium]|nr:heparinase II/III family protein [Beijerinckiaceae bacterium]
MSGHFRRRSVFETIRIANATAGTAVRRGSRRLSTLVVPVRLATPTRLLIAPQDLRSSDATIAQDIFAGRLTFAGRHIETGGRSPFDITPPSYAFAEELHGFGWLRHARAAETEAARSKARELVADWIDLYGRVSGGFSMQPAVLLRRLISWTTHSPLLLQDADETFYRNFVKSLHRQAVVLLKERRVGVAPLENLPSLLGLAYYALCTDRSEKLGAAVQSQLVASLESEILPDGGHVSRNPQILIDLLFDLLPLQQAFSARNLKVPQEIPSAIARMIQMLRLLRHGDGALALFNGMGVTEASQLATLLAYGSSRTPLQQDASYSGYQRLEIGSSALLVDAGRIPPAKWSATAHAGCLSFEFSAKGVRLFVNCGAPRAGQDVARQLVRSTAAHCTLTLDDRSSCAFLSPGRSKAYVAARILSGPKHVTYGREATDGGDTLIARHDGYEKEFGLQHQRSLWLGDDGDRLEGQDMLVDAPPGKLRRRKKLAGEPIAFALRFHLHPSVKPALSEDRKSVMLEAGARDRWVFEAGGLLIDLEESIFFATRQGQQRTAQIVVAGLGAAGAAIDWSLTFQR